MSIENRFFCDAVSDELITTRVDCAFKPAETKRAFLALKGFLIETASENLNDPIWWENAIKNGYIVPLPDGVFVDVSQNPQEGTVGTKTIKLSDGETSVSYQASLTPCLVSQLSRLEANNSAYDIFFITAIPQLIGKYDADLDAIYPLTVNSIDVRSKPLANDGTAVEGIQDTVIIRYNEVQSKNVRYFNISDVISNLTGLREVILEVQDNTIDSVTVKVVTTCEGIAVDDLTDNSDFTILDSTGAEVVISGVTSQGNGIYLIDASLTATEIYKFGIPTVGSNNESYTSGYTSYTAV